VIVPNFFEQCLSRHLSAPPKGCEFRIIGQLSILGKAGSFSTK
jgi:hypothetical protein